MILPSAINNGLVIDVPEEDHTALVNLLEAIKAKTDTITSSPLASNDSRLDFLDDYVSSRSTFDPVKHPVVST